MTRPRPKPRPRAMRPVLRWAVRTARGRLRAILNTHRDAIWFQNRMFGDLVIRVIVREIARGRKG